MCGAQVQVAAKLRRPPPRPPPQRSYRLDGGQVPHQTPSSESGNEGGGEKWKAVTVFHAKH